MLKLCPLMVAILNFRSAQKHNFCRGPSNDHSCNVCFELGLLVSEENYFLKHFPIESYVKIMTADGGHLEFLIGTKNTIFVEVHPMTIHAMFALN